MENNFQERESNVGGFEPAVKPQPRRWVFGFWIVFLVSLVAVGCALLFKTGFTFSQMTVGENPAGVLPVSEDAATPTPESDRLNILLLGLRGEDDPNGGLLTDSIIVASVKKSTGQVALISLPRDLYIEIPGQNGLKEKINFAYAQGYEKNGSAGAIYLSKIAVSRITGLYISQVAAINHEAFKEVVDILGGIDVYLENPFQEKNQFAKEILIDLPAGKNHLDGITALYFVRSRFSTSDFDRARRQQLVLLAIKDKALSLGFLANPVKIFQVLESLGRNVRTDASFSEMSSWLGWAQNIKTSEVIHKVFDTTPGGLLYSSTSASGAYILLPAGDDFSQIQAACRQIFDSAPEAAESR
ncbi:MAG: LCP family protein [Candidatus Portnoybacteria bacterium]|jgi:LCP family protein required for cell wall assembly|nr:LCP family protein [Candidatus Portnoybacteria bacterium]